MHSQRGRRLQGDFDEASTGGSAAVSPRTRQGREDPLSRALSRGEAQTPDGPAEPASRLPSALPPDTHRPAAFTGTAGEGEEGPSYGFATPTGAQRGLSRPVGLRSRPRAAAHAMWATPTVAGSRPASRQHTPAHSALWGRREQLITEVLPHLAPLTPCLIPPDAPAPQISSIDSKLRRHKTLGSAGMASLERSSSAGVMAEASSVGAARARAPLSRTRER